MYEQCVRGVAPQGPCLHRIADELPVFERERLEAVALFFGPCAFGGFHRADQVLFVVPAHGKDSEVDDGAHRPHHVRTLVDDVAGLVKRVAPAYKAEGVYDALEFVGAAVYVTYVESSGHD